MDTGLILAGLRDAVEVGGAFALVVLVVGLVSVLLEAKRCLKGVR